MAKADFGDVYLGFKGQILQKSRRWTHRDNEQPGRKRIEGSSVANPFGAKSTADIVDHIVGGHPNGLVD